MASTAKPIYSVSVRELVQFVLRRGNLGGDGEFVRGDRALAGTRGHQKIQRSRSEGYEKEVRVKYDVETEEFILRIAGRIDGLERRNNETVLEEIKTIAGRWDRKPDHLHWAQAKFYAFIHGRELDLERLSIRLTYLILENSETVEFEETFSLEQLTEFFDATAAIYLEWIQDWHAWCGRRNQSINALEFPFPSYRRGQREFAVAAYRTLANGGRLYLEAPTGIGKTVSAIFPAMKAMGEGKLERIFYLTARTVVRTIAEKAFGDLRKGGLSVRTVTLTAKDKVCVRNGQRCEIKTCPLAIGYYDRCRPAMREALARGEITASVLKEVGEKHQVCPFELSLDVSTWVDAIICDYNYVFDPTVYLKRHFDDRGGDYAFLVDEAHNLVDRAREMYSADIDAGEIVAVQRAIKSKLPTSAKRLSKLASALRALCRPDDGDIDSVAPEFASEESSLFSLASAKGDSVNSQRRNLSARAEQGRKAKISRTLPSGFAALMDKTLEDLEAWLARNEPTEFRDELLELFFRLHSFRRTAEMYDERYVTILDAVPSARIKLFCLDPSFLLRQALERGKAAVFFSATLTPIDYYRALLAGEPSDNALQLPSPFAPENLVVMINDRISTQYKARSETLAAVVTAIGDLIQQRRGNYLVYFPSHQYMTAALAEFQLRYPHVAILVQRANMSEPERAEFLAAFSVEHGDTLVGFALLGGIFGEGIDLVGERLIGAIIVGVGLPQLCVERDLIRDYFDERYGSGFDYAYTFPGMNRVLQAVGRVIRSERDRGVALLIDSRFGQMRYRRLFPPFWNYVRVGNALDVQRAAASFWHEFD